MNGTLVAVIAILVAGGLAIGYLGGVSVRQTITTISISNRTFVGSQTQSTQTFAACTILDPSKGLMIQVNNGTKPVGDASISVQDISNCWGGNVPRVVGQYDVTTNSTGWAGACGEYDGTCNLLIHFDGVEYPLSVSLVPGNGLLVVYDLATGNETVNTSS